MFLFFARCALLLYSKEAMIRDLVNAHITKFVPEAAARALEFQDDDAHGHYATNCAFGLAKKRGKPPIEVAEEIAETLRTSGKDIFMSVEAVAPGFVNMWLRPEIFLEEIQKNLVLGSEYGKNTSGNGRKIRIEYVSANPTGPIHIGNARGGPYGESLARIFEMSGYEVFREYFHNDAGTQVEKLGATVWYWYEKILGKTPEFPEGGYQGTYLEEVAHAVHEKLGGALSIDDMETIINFTLDFIFKENEAVLSQLGIHFDAIFKESDFLSGGKTDAAIALLKEKKVLKESEGAWWFAPKDEFLEDRESVVVRSNGKPTYFASDIAYHKEKFESGYDVVIDVFGSNHHGHVPKLQALTKLFGFDPNNFLVLLYQFVRVKKGNEVVKMSKRAGTYVTAKEVIEEVGSDNVIFSLLSSAPATHLDFDLDLAKEQSMKNPVYYVQYAHVRAENIIEKTGIEFPVSRGEVFSQFVFSPHDIALMRRIAEFPDIIRATANDYEVHRLTRYAFELARTFHNFYEHERVIDVSGEISTARLALVFAARNTLQSIFRCIGISAPRKM